MVYDSEGEAEFCCFAEAHRYIADLANTGSDATTYTDKTVSRGAVAEVADC